MMVGQNNAILSIFYEHLVLGYISLIERAILWGLAMHPDERPSSVAELQAELFAPSPVSRAVGRLFDREQPLAQFVRVNRGLLALIAALLLATTFVTARPATIPPPPTSTPSPTPAAAQTVPTATWAPTPKATATITPSPTATPRPSSTPVRRRQ